MQYLVTLNILFSYYRRREVCSHVAGRGRSRVWKGKGGCTLLKRLKTKKKRRSRVSEGSSNITMKYIIIIPVYSFTDKLHCLIKTATALLELLTAL